MQAVARGAAVLRALADSEHGLGVQEVAKAVSLPLGSTHRMLAALAEEEFVSRDPVSGRFSISGGLYQIAVRGFGRSGLVAAASAPLARLQDTTGETAFLCQLVGRDVVCVAIAETDRPLRLFVKVGQPMPPHAAASARVILAQCAPAEADAVLSAREFRLFTSTTPMTRDEVMARLSRIREFGYDICDDELDEHVWAVSAPITVAEESILGSVTVAAPSRRASGGAHQVAMTEAVVKTAHEIQAATRAWYHGPGIS